MPGIVWTRPRTPLAWPLKYGMFPNVSFVYTATYMALAWTPYLNPTQTKSKALVLSTEDRAMLGLLPRPLTQ